MNLKAVAIFTVVSICFFLITLFSAIYWSGRNPEIADVEHLFDFFAGSEEPVSFTNILIESVGRVFPGRLSTDQFDFNDGQEFCLSMNMKMLEKPAKIIPKNGKALVKNRQGVYDGFDIVTG